MTRIVIIGGGPAGYEAALVAAQLGAQVTVIERDGIGGASVLTDCVPSKTLIAAAGTMTSVRDSAVLGLQGAELATVSLDLASVNHRVKGLAMAQSADIHDRLTGEGVRIVSGQGRLSDEIRGLAAHRVEVLDDDGRVTEELESDVVLIATGADPRVLPGAEPDGERILDWRDVYELDEMPEHLVVVGSGVTGAEFASGYLEAGVPVTLVSSRDQVLPGEDADAAEVLEEVFQSRGGRIAERGRAATVKRTEKGVLVELTDGRTVEGSHALMTVGTVPNTAGLNLEQTGVEVTPAGHIVVDRVSRTSRARASTPPATSPASSSWPRSPPCRAASPCGTRSARRWPRSSSRPSRPTSSPIPRSPRWGSSRSRSPTTRTSTSSGCRWPPTPAPR